MGDGPLYDRIARTHGYDISRAELERIAPAALLRERDRLMRELTRVTAEYARERRHRMQLERRLAELSGWMP